ncbi:MAG: O-antigen ligase family protein, partial [Actinomycetia bacterium]|nr:O-antigen ligase family protein [Actinomycetes bacterium]
LAICWAILVLTVWLASTDQLSFSSPWTALVRAAVLITVAGLVAATLQLEYATDDYTTRFGLKRLSGVTWHPNTQGALGAVCVFGSLWPFRARIHLLERLAWLAIGILAIAWSQTYTAALGVVVALAVEAFRLSGRKARIALVAIAVAVACTFSALGPAETATRLARKRQVEATLSLNGRLDHWEEGLDVFAENPISGLGMGSAGLPSASARGFSARRASTHNVLVETALEWGVVGLAGLATGVVMLLLHLRRQAWNALAPVAGLVAMLMLLPTSGLMPTAVISTFAVASAAGEPALRGGRPQRRDEVTELKHLDRPTTRGPTRR